MELLSFGDIFEYEGLQYVYLDSPGKVTYAAKIVPRRQAQSLINYRDKIQREGSEQQQYLISQNVVYCFVELETEGYRGDIAELANTDTQRDEKRFVPQDEKLCEKDLHSLKDEIVNGSGYMPRGLKRRIADLEL